MNEPVSRTVEVDILIERVALKLGKSLELNDSSITVKIALSHYLSVPNGRSPCTHVTARYHGVNGDRRCYNVQ